MYHSVIAAFDGNTAATSEEVTYMFGMTAGLIGMTALVGFAAERAARGRDQRRALPGRLIDADGVRIHVTIQGKGGPPVVIIPGAGESSYSWLRVSEDISRFTTVITYDRSGLGSSDVRDKGKPMDPVEELRAVLEASGVRGPYVLMGHSLGGVIARLFVTRYPDEVAGMVFVDSTHEYLLDDAKFWKGMSAIRGMLGIMRFFSGVGIPRLFTTFGLMPMFPERAHYKRQLTVDQYNMWLASFYRNVRSRASTEEFSIVFDLLQQARNLIDSSDDARGLGNRPIAVLTNPGFGDAWIEMHRELAERSTNSVHYINTLKGHNIQMVNPRLVIDATRQVVESAATHVPMQRQSHLELPA